MDSKDGKDELVLGKGEKSKLRGQRQPRTLTVETYQLEDQKSDSSGSSVGTTKSSIGLQSEVSKVNFFFGNPNVEVLKGVLHLYKENERTLLSDEYDSGKSEMLCMIAIPASLNCRDLLQFVAPFRADMENIKILRDGTPNQYMALVKFKTANSTDSFYKAFNGTTFNSFEDDVCHLVYVSRLETMRDEDGAGLPLVGHTELPTCPVCLERMDESVDGILTILCNHSFHSACLSKWSDSSCPVCRYVQTPEMVASNQCCECQSAESLWICIICGHIGCGRYVQGHAYKHFCETSHCYAIQPDNNRVWDYVGDNFVHRLLQNKTDGKLVAVTGAETAGDHCEDSEDKLDSMQLEFTYLLTTQLENQRSYYQDCMGSLKKELTQKVETLGVELDNMKEDNKVLNGKVSTLQKEKNSLEKRLNQATTKLSKVTLELKEEKELNKSLTKSQVEWAACNSSLEKERDSNVSQYKAEIKDLREQLRDLMFFIEAKKRIGESSLKGEIQDGQLVTSVDESAQKPSTSKGSRRKQR